MIPWQLHVFSWVCFAFMTACWLVMVKVARKWRHMYYGMRGDRDALQLRNAKLVRRLTGEMEFRAGYIPGTGELRSVLGTPATGDQTASRDASPLNGRAGHIHADNGDTVGGDADRAPRHSD